MESAQLSIRPTYIMLGNICIIAARSSGKLIAVIQ